MDVPHVDKLHRRKGEAVDALGEVEPLHPKPALGPRRGAAREKHGAGLLCAPFRDAARVVARIGLLLVRSVVFLVDHDEAEIAKRREHGGARAHAYSSLAAAKALPLV